MIKFHSFLADDMEDFLVHRKDMGYTYHKLRGFLFMLDDYVKKKHVRLDDMTPGFFLEFRQTITGEPGTANRVFITLRSFFDYLVRMDRLSENPLRDIPPLKVNAYVPFMFSPDQVDALLSVIQKKIRKTEPISFLRDLAYFTALSLMARCGMRISEPLRLKNDHYRPAECTLYIEKTKFNKDRLIPVTRDVACGLDNYLSVRKAVLGENRFPNLLSTQQGPLQKWLMYKTFRQAVKNIGINHPKQTIGNVTFGQPCTHSLRHSFAVNSLRKACGYGRSPENVLPILAAYLGHTDYRYTMKYLKVLDSEHLNAWVNFCIFKRAQEDM